MEEKSINTHTRVAQVHFSDTCTLEKNTKVIYKCVPVMQHSDQNSSQLNCQVSHLVQAHYQWSYAVPKKKYKHVTRRVK